MIDKIFKCLLVKMSVFVVIFHIIGYFLIFGEHI